MTNINPGQFLLNLLTGINNAAAARNMQAQAPETSVFQQPQQPQQPQTQTLFPNATAQLAQTSAQLAELNQNQTSQMLKELLNMPQNMKQVLEQLTTNKGAENVKTALQLLNSSADISLLSSLLQNASKTANTNLYKMLAQFNQLGMSLKEEQITQLTKMISVISASSTSEAQSLKTLMLLYLPWLPLTDPDAMKWEIMSKKGGDDASGIDSITVLISTENYGNLQAVMTKLDEEGIRADITSSKTFPKEILVSLMKEESKKYSININCYTEVKSEFDKEKAKTSKTKVCMNSSPGVNPFLILISGALIKHVHEIDSRENLREQRKELLS